MSLCENALKFGSHQDKTWKIINQAVLYKSNIFFYFLSMRSRNLIQSVMYYSCYSLKYQKPTATILFFSVLKVEFSHKLLRALKTVKN